MRSRILGAGALCALVALIGVAGASGAEEPDGARGPWQLVRSDKGIVVHRRTVAGSQLKEFRGIGVIEAPVSAVMAVLNDSEHRREWMAESKEQRTLEQIDLTTVVLYSRLAAPWPVADRDLVMRATTRFEAAQSRVVIEISSTTHPSAPPVKGVVRMPSMQAHWHLSPVLGGKWTHAEYQVHVNAGGSLPTWLANLSSKKIPYDTIAALQKQVKQRQYPEYQSKIEGLPEYRQLMAASAAAQASGKPAGAPTPSPPGHSPAPGSTPASVPAPGSEPAP
jgi:uncharacterized protein YndB with AHSA1/START domain